MIETGFKKLDEKLQGNGPGSLVILAGRPAMGKTSLTCCMVSHVAINLKQPVLFLSLEMGRDALVQRILCANAGVDIDMVKSGHLSNKEWPSLTSAAGRISEAPIFIEEYAENLSEIVTVIREQKRNHDLALVVIDPIQLIRRWAAEPLERNVRWVTQELKSIAVEIRTPVIAISQLPRSVDYQDTAKPSLSHLQSEGEIERDADAILFLFREEFYNPTKENRGKAELLIGKNRCGPIGRIDLSYDAQTLRFDQNEI